MPLPAALSQKFRRKLRNNPVNMVADDISIIVERFSAQAVRPGVMGESTFCFAAIIKRLTQCEIQMKTVFFTQVFLCSCGLHCAQIRIVKFDGFQIG